MKILKSKTCQSLINHIVANYIIAANAIYKANMPAKQECEAIDVLTDNTIEVIETLSDAQTAFHKMDLILKKVHRTE